LAGSTLTSNAIAINAKYACRESSAVTLQHCEIHRSAIDKLCLPLTAWLRHQCW